MNERIKQLAEQAGLYDEKTPEEVPGFTACFEKFAELIVKECVANLKETKKAELPLLQAINEDTREVPLSVYIMFLKEHFGVEL